MPVTIGIEYAVCKWEENEGKKQRAQAYSAALKKRYLKLILW